MKTRRQKYAIKLRRYRKLHRVTGILTFVAFILIGITGILLGWKKNTNGLILPKTVKGISSNVEEFKSISELSTIALGTLENQTQQTQKISRIDVRPSKGVVKVIFKNNHFGVQVDAKTGEVLQVRERYSDLIENIHDGSYFDDLLGIKAGYFKLIYTLITGLALLLFSFTGFWLWYGPKRMRKE